MTKLEKPLTLVATRAYKDFNDGKEEMDFSMPDPDPCYVFEEDEGNWYGRWVFGICMFGVRFPKETTRRANDGERKRWDGNGVVVGDQSWVSEIIHFD